jgi:hypothetical protein
MPADVTAAVRNRWFADSLRWREVDSNHRSRSCERLPRPSKILLSNATSTLSVNKSGTPVRGLRSKSRPLVMAPMAVDTRLAPATAAALRSLRSATPRFRCTAAWERGGTWQMQRCFSPPTKPILSPVWRYRSTAVHWCGSVDSSAAQRCSGIEGTAPSGSVAPDRSSAANTAGDDPVNSAVLS